MSTKETGGPAFPRPVREDDERFRDRDYHAAQEGMTLRQYAAIKLKVPDSGEDWLDAMILTALRNDFAARAMAGELASESLTWDEGTIAHVTQGSYLFADAMLKASK